MALLLSLILTTILATERIGDANTRLDPIVGSDILSTEITKRIHYI